MDAITETTIPINCIQSSEEVGLNSVLGGKMQEHKVHQTQNVFKRKQLMNNNSTFQNGNLFQSYTDQNKNVVCKTDKRLELTLSENCDNRFGSEPAFTSEQWTTDQSEDSREDGEPGPFDLEADPADPELLTEERLEATEHLLRAHSGCGGPWQLCRSPLGGRGLVAARDLRAGDLVLRDPPLLLAPRAANASAPVCLRCHRRAARLQPCRRCRVPVCCQAGDVAASPDHHAGECALLASWGLQPPDTTLTPHLVRACAAVRCLALPPTAQEVMRILQAHPHPRYRQEVEALSRLAAGVPARQQAALEWAARLLDTNAFETPLDGDRRPAALSCRLRGLFPLGAMMNHACSPNTTHGYDAGRAMVVRAAADVPRGAELTTSYAPLLWGTVARRAHLAASKGFLCRCPRCSDPQEMGALLSGLRCGRAGCSGALLSPRPLEPSSAWRCTACGWQLSAVRAQAAQAALGSLLDAVDGSRPDAVTVYLRSPQISSVLLPTNQVTVELKSCLVWLYGHAEGFSWQELEDQQLELKAGLCREMLHLLRLLGVGRCRLRGLFLYELHCTLSEKRRRGGKIFADKDTDAELSESLEEAADIFQYEAMAPPDLAARLERLRLAEKR